ncbi:hypothetical protein GCM10010313_19020 [Streptomyces violarus]|uniref:Uncharacterized protein n=1 Tax=Streptomyces violarus TaxID=67380 RepID=A0A7W4ZN18_9ACTN|nr:MULTISPECIES: hypothetical protein [Streptomyces]MBB3075428.1 hypothetical protein [Streptomyces violarus]WRT98032.1 hypothetical protein VJ737_10225 [Streptomyces sp. CGMCC 4.1772]GHD03706.1 hypothetical protein GCM10010313_19020 [Streptomyces violarus]
MRPHRPRGLASPASGVLRGLRAGVLAVLCVLLPLAGHVLAQCHAPRWIIVAGTAAVAVPGATVLTRRRLTDTQVLAVLAAAQLACHAAYSLPGACAAVAEQGGAVGGLARLVAHDAVAGPSPGVVLAGQAVTLLLAARLLGLTERLVWQSRTLRAVVRRLLLFLWPLLSGRHGNGPRVAMRESAAPPVSALLVRLNEGRAPPRHGRGPFVLPLLRPMPTGGPCLP